MNKDLISFFRFLLICLLAPFAVVFVVCVLLPILLVVIILYSFIAPGRLRSTIFRARQKTEQRSAQDDEIDVDCTVIHSEEVGDRQPDDSRSLSK